jgi:hypothetical protein
MFMTEGRSSAEPFGRLVSVGIQTLGSHEIYKRIFDNVRKFSVCQWESEHLDPRDIYRIVDKK